MTPLTSFLPFCRATLVLATGFCVLVPMTGCHPWRPVPPWEVATSRSQAIPRARIILKDRTEIELSNVFVRSDSVVGIAEWNGARRAISMDTVKSVESREASTGPSAVLILKIASLVVAGLVVLAMSAASSAGGP